MSSNDIQQKSVKKNAIFNVIYRVFNMIFPLVTAVYVSHVLMAKGVGKVGVAQNIVQYFVLIAPLGIANYGTREIAKIRKNKSAVNKLFTELFTLNFCSTLFCVLTFYILVSFGDYFSAERSLYLVAGTLIVFNFINVEWFYQGNEEYVYISIRNIIVKTLSLIAILIFVRAETDYIVYALIYVLGVGGNSIFNILNLRKYNVRLDYSNLEFGCHFKPIVILLCSNIAIELYTLLDTTMLGYVCEDEIVGYYTNSIKLVRIIVSLIAAIGGVLLPRLSYYKHEEMYDECASLINSVTRIILLFAIPCGIGVAILAPQLVLVLFGDSFMPAVKTVRVATILIYVLGFSNLFGTQVLLTFNKEKQLLFTTIVGALINIGLNYLLISRYQHNGAVVASVVSESVVTLLTIIFAKKNIAIRISLKYIIQVIIAGLSMCLPVIIIAKNVENSILCIIASVITGCCTYFAICLLVKNEIVKSTWNNLKRRMKNEEI